MKNLKAAAVLSLALILLAGCGKKSETVTPDDSSYVPEDTLSVDDNTVMLGNDNIGDDESLTESEMIRQAGDTANTKGDPGGKLPDYLRGSYSDFDPVIPENGDIGEALNTAPGDKIITSEKAEGGKLGEAYTIHTANGDMELKVTSVDTVPNTDKNLTAKEIIKVSYEYTNVSVDSELMVGDICFRLADDEGKALGAYLPDYTQEENPEPSPINKGETCKAVIAYALYEDSDEFTLFFDDMTKTSDAQEIFWVIK